MKKVRVRDARRRKGLTQEQLAKRLGCHQAQINKLETSVSDPRFSTGLAVADALGVDPHNLLFGQREAE